MSATTLEGAIVAVLKADTGVTAIASTRIHPTADPQSTTPRPKITYQRTGTRRDTQVGGATNDGPTGAALATLQFDCLADDPLTAKHLAAAVRVALNGKNGILSGIFVGGLNIDDERESPLPPYAGEERGVQRVVLIAKALYAEQA